MTGWLLDTNVLSVFAPGKPAVAPHTSAWFEERTDQLLLSAITAAEIEAGISKAATNRLRQSAPLRPARPGLSHPAADGPQLLRRQ